MSSPPKTNIQVPRRVKRSEKVAAIKTIAQRRRGAASSECQCRRCFTEEKPDSSSTLMKLGSAQKESVSGGEKTVLDALQGEVGRHAGVRPGPGRGSSGALKRASFRFQ